MQPPHQQKLRMKYLASLLCTTVTCASCIPQGVEGAPRYVRIAELENANREDSAAPFNEDSEFWTRYLQESMSIDPTPERSISLGNVRPEYVLAGPDPSTLFVTQFCYGGVSSVNIVTGEIKEIVPKKGFLERGGIGIAYTGEAFIVAGSGPTPLGFSQTAVYVYDATTGEDIATCVPLVGDEGFMNDIAIVDGKAYITDTNTPNLMVMDIDLAVKEGVCDVSSIDISEGFAGLDFPGVNGIVSYGDGLLIGATSSGTAYFLDLNDNSLTEVISQDGGAAQIDGMLIQDDMLYITQLNNLITVWTLSGGTNGDPVTAVKEGEIASPLFDSSSVSAIIDDYIYTANIRLGIELPAPGEEDLSMFDEEFVISVIPNPF